MFKVKEVSPGENAEKLGVKPGDIFISVGKWNIDSTAAIPHRIVPQFTQNLDSLDKTSKEIRWLRMENNEAKILKTVFPPGKLGVVYTWEYLPPERFSELRKLIKGKP